MLRVESAGAASSSAAPSDETELAAALQSLLERPNAERTYTLCEAEPETGACADVEDGLSAIGLGGYALPLYMELSAVTVDEVDRAGDGWSFRSRFRSRVNGIPPLCFRSTAEVTLNSAGSANIVFGRFFCNWAVIGNVFAGMKLSVNRVDLSTQSFAGYYSLYFNGTGNAGGSGYYRATPLPDPEG